jgi:hypothetical protein
LMSDAGRTEAEQVFFIEYGARYGSDVPPWTWSDSHDEAAQHLRNSGCTEVVQREVRRGPWSSVGAPQGEAQ